ncbi:MAG: hypothetical protein ACXVP5_11080, partial [Tumebacillaceae bacterium]
SPKMASSPDVISRGASFKQVRRPGPLRPVDKWRQKKYTKSWDPTVHDSQEALAQERKERRKPGLLTESDEESESKEQSNGNGEKNSNGQGDGKQQSDGKQQNNSKQQSSSENSQRNQQEGGEGS